MAEDNANTTDPALWDQLLASSSDQFAAAEAFDGNAGWEPAPGDYQVMITAVRTGTFSPKKTPDKTCPYWAPKGEILGVLGDTSDLDVVGNSIVGREFDLDFLSNQSEGALRNLKTWSKMLADGDTVSDMRVADSLLKGAVGTVLNVTYSVSKGGFKNVRILEKLDLDGVDAAPEAPEAPEAPATA